MSKSIIIALTLFIGLCAAGIMRLTLWQLFFCSVFAVICSELDTLRTSLRESRKKNKGQD